MFVQALSWRLDLHNPPCYDFFFRSGKPSGPSDSDIVNVLSEVDVLPVCRLTPQRRRHSFYSVPGRSLLWSCAAWRDEGAVKGSGTNGLAGTNKPII